MSLGWQQETIAESAREVQQLGAELYERLRTMSSHLQGLQRSLTASVEAYNKAVGSLEGRVLVTARRFVEMGVVGAGEKELPHPPSVDATTRALQSPELSPPTLDLPFASSSHGFAGLPVGAGRHDDG